MTISQALKEIYASAPASQRYIETLTFSHSLFPQTYYLTNDNQPWIFKLETGVTKTFAVMPFRIVLPTQDGQGNQDMGITLANIGRDMVDPIEAANALPGEPIKCTYRVYIDQANSMPQNDPVEVLTINAVEITRESVTATAKRSDVLSRAFPYPLYTYQVFPGLRR